MKRYLLGDLIFKVNEKNKPTFSLKLIWELIKPLILPTAVLIAVFYYPVLLGNGQSIFDPNRDGSSDLLYLFSDTSLSTMFMFYFVLTLIVFGLNTLLDGKPFFKQFAPSNVTRTLILAVLAFVSVFVCVIALRNPEYMTFVGMILAMFIFKVFERLVSVIWKVIRLWFHEKHNSLEILKMNEDGNLMFDEGHNKTSHALKRLDNNRLRGEFKHDERLYVLMPVVGEGTFDIVDKEGKVTGTCYENRDVFELY